MPTVLVSAHTARIKLFSEHINLHSWRYHANRTCATSVPTRTRATSALDNAGQYQRYTH